MRAVMATISDDILALRKRTGADRFDEMWDEVLHMAPMPTGGHQDLETSLIVWMQTQWRPATGGRSHHQRNVASVGNWPNDYRVPDLMMLLPDRFGIDHDTHLEGGPTAVIEIRSPGDETDEKLPWYARIGVLEAWVIDRDTYEVELYVLRSGRYRRGRYTGDGWLRGPVTNIEMRREEDGSVIIGVVGNDRSRCVIGPA